MYVMMSEAHKVHAGMKVPPGDETGLYYIIVANLPWQCSWQRLKDFARNQQPDGSCLNVDHAMVYPGITNGWVRIKGKEDFHKALAHLDGGIFEYRALMADGRNETAWVHLPHLSNTRAAPSSRRSRQGSAASSSSMYTQQPCSSITEYSNQDYYSPASSFSPVNVSFPLYVPQAPAVFETPEYVVQEPVDYRPPVSVAGGVTFAGNMAPLTPVYIAPSVYNYMAKAPYSGMLAPPVSEVVDHQKSAQQPVIKTEARKIIITQLPHSTDLIELGGLLRKTLERLMLKGNVPNDMPQSIQGLEIPAHSDGKPKGHAFAVFADHYTAKCVVNALDNLKFQGRLLKARLAKEGVESPRRALRTSTETHSTTSSERQSSLASTSPRSSGRMSKRDERLPPPTELDVASMASLEIGDVRPQSSASTSRHAKAKESSTRHRVKPEETLKSNRAAWNGTPAVVDGSSSGQRFVRDGGRERKHRS